MDTILDDLPPRTHNNPPDPIEELRTQLAETHESGLVSRKAELLAMGERAPAAVDDEDTAAKIANGIKACAAFAKNAEAARVSAKEPYRKAASAVDGWFAALADPVDKVKGRLTALLTDYQKRVAAAERARREAEAAELRRQQQEAERQRQEAERLAREARAAARRAEDDKAAADAERLRAEQDARDARGAADRAAADAAKATAAAAEKPAEMSRQRTDLGAVASLRRTWKFRVVNPEIVPRSFLTVDNAAITAFIKASTNKATHQCDATIPGVEIYPDDQARVS